MESVHFGGRAAAGFGVGNPLPQGAYVREAPSGLAHRSGKIGAFLSGGAMSVVASAAAVALAGEGPGYLARVSRAWQLLAVTAVTGGVVGVVAA